MKRIWLFICRFAFRRVMAGKDRQFIPVGLPYMRDPDSPCEHFTPSRKFPGWIHPCRGDGHYLCKECRYFEPEEERERE